jgi:hypothetical protein
VAVDEVFAPLTRGLARPASATFRGDAPAASAAADAGARRIDDIRGTVRVLEPPSPYSLGTSDAPLPLTVANGLPMTVQVRVQIASTPGLRMAPIAVVQIPPLGRRQVSANAQVTRSGQFTVDATVLTPDGGVLGPASRLRVRSTVYGTITVWLTVGAGVLLVVLAVRRVVRRIRGEPGRHAGPAAKTDPTVPPTPEPTPAEPPTRPVGVHPPDPPPTRSPASRDPGGFGTPAWTPTASAPAMPSRDLMSRPPAGTHPTPAPSRGAPAVIPAPVPVPNRAVPGRQVHSSAPPVPPTGPPTPPPAPGDHPPRVPLVPSTDDLQATDRLPTQPP